MMNPTIEEFDPSFILYDPDRYLTFSSSQRPQEFNIGLGFIMKLIRLTYIYFNYLIFYFFNFSFLSLNLKIYTSKLSFFPFVYIFQEKNNKSLIFRKKMKLKYTC